MPVEEGERGRQRGLVVRGLADLDGERLQEWRVLAAAGEGGVCVSAGGDSQAEALGAPEGGADEVHGAYDMVHNAVFVLLRGADAREFGPLLEAYADVERARLGALQTSPNAFERLVRAHSDR